MKKIYSVLTLAVMLAIFLCLPVSAAQTHGVIYDETDELGSATLTMQGEETLPELSEKLGIDLRVDVLTQVSYDSELTVESFSIPIEVKATSMELHSTHWDVTYMIYQQDSLLYHNRLYIEFLMN